MPFDINRAQPQNPAEELEADAVIREMFTYSSWSEEQVAAREPVVEKLIDAVRTIVRHVPPCADRTVAIRKLREARMDCNSAITHGKY